MTELFIVAKKIAWLCLGLANTTTILVHRSFATRITERKQQFCKECWFKYLALQFNFATRL